MTDIAKPNVQAMRDAVASDPKNNKLRLKLAGALIDASWFEGSAIWKSNYDEAAEIYEAVLTEESNNAIALVNLGVVLSDQGFHKRALDCYRRAESLHWIDGNLQYNIGVALVNLGDDDSGDRYLQMSTVLTDHPDTIKAYFDPQAH